MDIATHGRASIGTQFDALLRKSINFQKRNKKQNCLLLIMPIVIFGLLASAQKLLAKSNTKETYGNRGGVLEIKKPTPLYPLIQVPANDDRAARFKFMPFADLPDPSCRRLGNCPITFLVTGTNQSLVDGVVENFFPSAAQSSADPASLVLGTEVPPQMTFLSDDAFTPGSPLFYIQTRCSGNSSISLPTLQVVCLEGLPLWRNSSSDINDEVYRASKGKGGGRKSEITAALDFLNTNKGNYNLTLCVKLYEINEDTKSEDKSQNALSGAVPASVARLPRLVNLASNAYVQHLQGPTTQMLFEFIKEVPTRISDAPGGSAVLDLVIPMLYMLMLLYTIPVLLRGLVYEKEHNLRLMMKMHGLGDTAYWMVNYAYALLLSFVYIQIFLLAGRKSGLSLFRFNDYSVLFVFLFIYINWSISLVFVGAAMLSTARSAQVIGTTFQLLMSFLGMGVMKDLVTNQDKFLIYIEMIPGFALARGLLDLQSYATFSWQGAGHGMQWKNMNDKTNGMKTVIIIMCIEWLVMLLFAYYIDQVGSSGSGRRKSPLFFLRSAKKKPATFKQNTQGNTSLVFRQRENDDVAQEREKVERLVQESNMSYTALCHNIKKIYPARDGNPPKAAVKGLSLALSSAECFGMLGPNGAGKSSFISMMIGLTDPTSGTAYIQGLDITTDMDEVYTCMGVCPQFDLLWETLTGREHLYFYGRLKNLHGSSLTQAVEESLKSVDLSAVGDRQAGRYSGGMKRRLSVAISLIGDPKIVYLDEPSTGLDPASRSFLWNVVREAKKDRAILLTTHSMEEAEALCDRLGIFVDGGLQCIGDSKELKARYGGYFVFTMTTPSEHDEEVENMVMGICRDAQKIYHLAGTQKFELPKQQVQLSDVFQLVEDAKTKFSVQAWALADTTLEDVFIKVARAAQDEAAKYHHDDVV